MPHAINLPPLKSQALRQKLKLTNEQALPRVVRLENVEDERDRAGYDVYAFKKIGGGYGRVFACRSEVNTPTQLDRVLCGANADLPGDRKHRVELLAKAMQRRPTSLQLAVRQVGWRSDISGFVGSGWVRGRKRGKRTLCSPLSGDRSGHKLGQRGTLAAWKAEVAVFAKYSSLLQVLMSAAFAAPLLGLIGWPSFTFCLHGKAKIGKTTAAIAAGSVIGFGSEEDLPKCNMTRAGILEFATLFRDHLLVLDETGLARDDAPIADQINKFTYLLSGGRDDTRHSSSASSSSADLRCRSIALITSEASIATMTSQGGRSRHGGEAARAYDLPALFTGEATIFDRAPSSIGDADKEAWGRELLRQLQQGCRDHHGTAYPAFIKFLLEEDTGARTQQVKTLVAEFRAQLGDEAAQGIAGHAAGSFGLVYAGGALAIEAGLLPIKRSRLLKTVVSYYRASFTHVKSPKQLEDEAMARLTRLLDRGALPTRKAVERLSKDEGFGGFRMIVSDRWHVCFKRAFLDVALRPEGGTSLLVPLLRRLHRDGLLVLRKGQEPVASGFNAASTDRTLWIGKGKVRCLQFLDPRQKPKATADN